MPSAPRELVVEMGKEDSGEVADRLRVQEIMLHEALDRHRPGALGIIHPAGDLALIIEGEALLRPPGYDVEVAAHGPEEAFGPLEMAQFLGREQADIDQFGHGLKPIGIFADPEEGVEVPKAAFAFLDVGLDDIAAVADPFVARARRAFR